MIPKQAWNLVPETFPERRDWITVAKSAALAENELRAYLWATHLLEELSKRYPNWPWYTQRAADVSAGFIQVKNGADDRTNRFRKMALSQRDIQTVEGDGYTYAFGLIVSFPKEYEWMNSPANIEPIDGFPLIFEPREIVPHAPPNPAGVSSACYAKPRSTKRFFGPTWSDGIITARHVLSGIGLSYGTVVPMAHGSSCSLVDIDGGTTIDAAIIDTTPFVAARLPLATVAPGSRVEIRSAIHPTFTADVLRIYEDKYCGNLMSHRVFIDTAGQSGDSGSLCVTPNAVEAVGIYIGSTATSGGEGLLQGMRQVVQYFDVDIFL